MELQKAINKIIQCAEDAGWHVNTDTNSRDGSICFDFNTDTPYGQDFWMTCYLINRDPQTLVKNVYDYWQDFDPDYEAYLWIGDDGHGKNGAPYHISSIVDDMKAAEKRMEELFDALNKLDFETNDE